MNYEKNEYKIDFYKMRLREAKWKLKCSNFKHFIYLHLLNEYDRNMKRRNIESPRLYLKLKLENVFVRVRLWEFFLLEC